MTANRLLRALPVIALTVAGCAPPGADIILAVPPNPPPAAQVERAPEPLPQPQVAVLPPVAPVAPAAPPPTPPPTMELAEFEGLDRFEIMALLGDPDLARDEPTAQVLQYGIRSDGNGADCALHLFLYQPQDGGPYRVEHAEVSSANPGNSGRAACITALLVRGAGG